MKKRIFQLTSSCLLIALMSVAVYAQVNVFSVTHNFRDIGTEVLKKAGSQVTDGFIFVPEPTSMLLFGSGLLALAARRKKRNSRREK